MALRTTKISASDPPPTWWPGSDDFYLRNSSALMVSDPITFLRTTDHHTPHHTDPPNASEFYAALGMLSVAWGRLEGQVIGNLLTIMSLLGEAPRKPPLQWEDRLEWWEKGFSSVPSLQPHRERAVMFPKTIIEEASDRNFAAHAAWDEFVPDADELTIRARAVKAKKGCPNTIEVDDRRIT
jgi:hypothetical protein